MVGVFLFSVIYDDDDTRRYAHCTQGPYLLTTKNLAAKRFHRGFKRRMFPNMSVQDTLLRAAAVSTRHIFEYNTDNTETNANSTRHMEDSFNGGNYYHRQANGGASAIAPPPHPPAPQQQQPGGAAAPVPVAGVDRNVSLLDLGEDENNLRTTCDGCTIGKIKCDGGHPCKRCLRRGSECIYREKK